MKRCLLLACVFGCDGATATPDAWVAVQYVGIEGQTAAIHAITMPAGIDCGPTTTQCQHAFVARSLVHLHIEQVDSTCGTVTLQTHVGDGSDSTNPTPIDWNFQATDISITVVCQ